MHDSKFEMKFEEEAKILDSICEKIAKDIDHDLDKGVDNMDVEVAGKMVDMVKDMCEAKEKVAKTCYYKSIVKAMEKAEEDEDLERRMMECSDDGQWGRMGYDRWRYPSSGRFAPKGRGRRSGYTPYLHMMEDMDDEYDFPEMMNYRMGYSGGKGGNSGMNRGGQSMNSGGRGGRDDMDGSYGYSMGNRGDSNNQGRNEGSRYGRSYDNYRTAKRHYTESQTPEEQKKMRESIAEVFDDMEDITVDMVKDMSAEDKAKYRKKLQDMMQKIQ